MRKPTGWGIAGRLLYVGLGAAMAMALTRYYFIPLMEEQSRSLGQIGNALDRTTDICTPLVLDRMYSSSDVSETER